MIVRVRVAINREFRRLSRLTLISILLLLLLQIAGSYYLSVSLWQHTFFEWIREAFIATVILLLVGAIALYSLYTARIRLLRESNSAIVDELYAKQAAIEKFEALQSMASTLSATLSFEAVVEQAVQVCGLVLEDLGLSGQSLVGVVFLFDGENLVPLQIGTADQERSLAGNEGVIGESLRQGEPAVTDNPQHDPELAQFVTYSDSLTVVSVPLRAGYQLFGAMVLGIDQAIRFEEKHFDLFNAVADHTVIALQNAQLFQRLEEEKQRLIEADIKARRELARDLHDGPVQKVAAIAMHLNVLGPMAARQPEKLPGELEKLEVMAKNASLELRDMLFTLRPLLLDSKGLGPAIESILSQISERSGIKTTMVGADYGQGLNRQTQDVVFSIVEEALSNVRKHAGASSIEVQFWQESDLNDLFVVRIADDGIGFDLDEVRRDYDTRGSMGLLNMQERAERIDGFIRIDSASGIGTTITLAVPLADNGLLESAEPEAGHA